MRRCVGACERAWVCRILVYCVVWFRLGWLVFGSPISALVGFLALTHLNRSLDLDLSIGVLQRGGHGIPEERGHQEVELSPAGTDWDRDGGKSEGVDKKERGSK